MLCTEEQAKKLVESNIGSLEDLCKQAICTADLNLMLAMGFPEKASKRLCEIVVSKAKKLGISDLEKHYSSSLVGGSNIINTIVRRFHRLYFATRANLHPVFLLEHIRGENGPYSDICSGLFSYSMKRSDESMEKRRQVLIERAKSSKNKVEAFIQASGAEVDDEDISDYFDGE